MKAKLIEHALSVFFVIGAFVILVIVWKHVQKSEAEARIKLVEPYLNLGFLDYSDPLHRALLKETLDLYYPDRTAKNDSLLLAIESFRQEQFTNQAYKTGGEERGLSSEKLVKLGNMYGLFILVYLLVMVLSYRVAQSLAVLRFIQMKQNRSSYVAELYRYLVGSSPAKGNVSFYFKAISLLGKAVVKGIGYAVLFSPAYVIGYSVRSTFETDSYFFMIVLGVVSNGLLINYANKFFTYLVTESRKGYVQAAIVKNLNASYAWGAGDGMSIRSVFNPQSLYPSHVFSHIYVNARYQYLLSLKEHASFLITGLIIIEMALNIQGHLGYELMQDLLYKEYDVAICIIAGIFLIVKGTEIFADAWFHVESRKYENRA